MTELYWLMVYGNIISVLNVAFIIFGIALALLALICLSDFLNDEDNHKSLRAILKKYLLYYLLGLSVFAFVPSKKNLLIIYGVGSTIDYIQSNDEAKKLPDNCIKAVNKFVKDYINE